MSIVVFGSINMDLVVRTPRLPAAGETVSGTHFSTVPGGKGANQAVAAACLGAPTHMVGRVGNDVFGQSLLETLRNYGVGIDRVTIDPSTASGVALIEVDAAGENRIVIVAGANGNVGAEEVDALQPLLKQASVLLLQLEIPMAAVVAAAQCAHAQGVTVILDPAPVHVLPPDLYPLIDILTPNQMEAEHLTGMTVTTPETAIAAATILRKRGVKTVIITLGAKGVVIVTEDAAQHVPAFSVEVVDTVAAGDAFNGGLASGLSEELSLNAAVMRGIATAALSVMRSGAQQSMPNSQTLREFLS